MSRLSGHVFDKLANFNTRDEEHHAIRGRIIAYFRGEYAKGVNIRIPDPLFFSSYSENGIPLLSLFFPEDTSSGQYTGIVHSIARFVAKVCPGAVITDRKRLFRGKEVAGSDVALTQDQVELLWKTINPSPKLDAHLAPWDQPGHPPDQATVKVYYDPMLFTKNKVMLSLSDHYDRAENPTINEICRRQDHLSEHRMIMGSIRIIQDGEKRFYELQPELFCITAVKPNAVDPSDLYRAHYLWMERLLFLSKGKDVLIISDEGLDITVAPTAYQAWENAWIRNDPSQRSKELIISHYQKDGGKVPQDICDIFEGSLIKIITASALVESAKRAQRGEKVVLLNPSANAAVGGLYQGNANTLEGKIASCTTLMQQHAATYNPLLTEALVEFPSVVSYSASSIQQESLIKKPFDLIVESLENYIKPPKSFFSSLFSPPRNYVPIVTHFLQQNTRMIQRVNTDEDRKDILELLQYQLKLIERQPGIKSEGVIAGILEEINSIVGCLSTPQEGGAAMAPF